MENQTEKLRYMLKKRQDVRPGDVVALASWGTLWEHYVVSGFGVYSPDPYRDDVVQFPLTDAENYKSERDFIAHADDRIAVLDPSQHSLVVWTKEKVDAEFRRWCAELEDVDNEDGV